jgi:carbamoyl-phosphate synthase large subunit
MAIGRNFAESLQKALRGLEIGLCGLDRVRAFENADPAEIESALARSTPDRLLVAAEALRQGFTVERINAIAGFDPWFLKRLQEIVESEEEVRINGLPSDVPGMRRLKAMGFSDARLAQLSLRSADMDRGMSEAVAAGGSGIVHDAIAAMTGGVTESEVRAHRERLGVQPVFKRIDSCAAEFDAATPYLYSTYEAPLFGDPEDEAEISDRRKVMILGGGPNRIGQGIEFDYCCCHAAFALGRDRGGTERRWLRSHHGQLQPGDGLDRPGHVGPPLFRAADRRRCPSNRPARAGEGRAAGRNRPTWRPDPAEARRGVASRRRADPGHLA